MSPGLRVFVSLASLPLVVGLLWTCAEAHAQSQNAPSEAAKAQSDSGPKKPVRKPDRALTDDTLALLAVKDAQPAAETPTVRKQPGAAMTGVTSGAAEDTEKKAAEIASLEKQIQDKTKRIALLLRLFVNDERPFLNDPANPNGDEASQERRKYEQDELLWETAELAKLKTRLNELTAARGVS